MFAKLKDAVKTRQWFWRYRHFLDFSVWSRYLESANQPHRAFYSEFAKRESITSVFELGCASGPNLKCISTECDLDFFVGIDINRKAIQLAKNQEWSCPVYFSTEVDSENVASTLRMYKRVRFDLGIYDRVLYLLDANQTVDHFELVAPMLSIVVIDDFHSDALKSNGVYYSKNYESILNQFGFVLSTSEISQQLIRDDFFAQCARRLVFRRET